MALTEGRAASPRIPPPTRALQRAEHERQKYLRQRKSLQLRSVVRALIFLAVLILLLSVFRAGFGRVFTHGWWRP